MANESWLKRIFNSKAFLFLVLVLLIWVAVSVVKVTYKKYLLNKEVAALRGEIEQLEGKNAELNDYLGYLQSESFIEKEARDKLNLKEEGEQVVIVRGAEDVSGGSSADFSLETAGGQTENKNEGEEKKKAFWWKWWEYFFE